jgi:hypothetical protein
MRTRPFGVLVFAAALVSGCDVQVGEQGVSLDIVEGKATDEWTRSYTLPKGGRLEIATVDGSIEAFPAAGSQVEVRAKREVRSRNDEAAQELLKQLAIKEDVTPDSVKLETPEPPRSGFRQRHQVEFRVNIPPGLNVSLRTQNGAVRLENVDGRLTASSTNGGITGQGVAGSIDANTVNGGIVLGLASIDGDVRVVTVNGGIRLDLPTTINATLDASAVNGGVSVQDGFPIATTERARLRVAGRINNGGPTISVHTTNGGIRIGSGRGGDRPDTIEPGLQAR